MSSGLKIESFTPIQPAPIILADREIRAGFTSLLKAVALRAFRAIQESASPGEFSCYLNQITSRLPVSEKNTKLVELTVEFNEGLVEEGLHRLPLKTDFERWVQDLTVTSLIFLDSKIVDEILPLSLPESIRNDLKEDLQADPTMLSRFSCFEYAFAQIGDTRAVCSDYGNLIESMQEWGYEQITTSPQAGDLVLYLDQGAPTHLGVCQENSLVLSKWGNQRPVAYIHHIEKVPTSYGNQVMFFRPPAR